MIFVINQTIVIFAIMVNNNISSKIIDILPKVREYMKSQPILRAWLFGSYSKGEESSDSDIDILVDFDETNGFVSLFSRGGILMDLTDILKAKVDLVDKKGLKDFAIESVEKDKILIYERAS